MDQFATACALLSEYLPNPISPDAMSNLARSIDINGDGVITLSEFLDAFQKVDEALSNKRAAESQQEHTSSGGGNGRDEVRRHSGSDFEEKTQPNDGRDTKQSEETSPDDG
jgi:Ca2+-binding EF-hand superfamily protein